jgi:flagellum-specific ATP synthase
LNLFERATAKLDTINPVASRGIVTDLTGLIIEANGPAVGIGATCSIVQGDTRLNAQVVGFKRDRILLMPFGDLHGIGPGATVISHGIGNTVLVSPAMLGRVLDPQGQPLDDGAPIDDGIEVPLFQAPPSPLKRVRIAEPCDVGIRAVNAMLTVGRGQRVAIMAGSGVGKSTFLGMIAKHSTSAVNVICLVGERGREVREFIERDLGPEGLRRSVVICATSDKSALMRIRAAFYATAIAEYFRDAGAPVNLMVDSVTRFCMAQREIGLAVGEPPSAAGYTPSVFALLPRLLERAGTCAGAGSITGFYTVLVEGDDMNEPIADAVRGILDGHIVLSRALAGRGHYPAIDVLQSVSRVMPDVVEPKQMKMAALARQVLADYAEVEDLLTIGAYRSGQNAKADFAIQRIDAVNNFLRQPPQLAAMLADSIGGMEAIFGKDLA